jgi:uncharacterized protein (DUF983 family)
MPEEEWTKTGLQLPGMWQAVRLYGRALRLRCPNCGARPVLRRWLKLRERCPGCGLRLERGEHDYFTGSILIAYIFVGLLFLGLVGITIIVTWPAVPWSAIEILAPVLAIAALIGLFPYSKLLWLAFDLMLRPVTPAELEWHRGAREQWSTDQPV